MSSQSSRAANAPSSDTVPVQPTTQGRILVTDDEPGIRQSLAMFLSRLGFEVIEAPTADAAVELLGQQTFDLVLSDIALPGSNTGLDLLAAVKHKSPDTDVILMTGHMDLDFAINALKRGASDYFKKPFLFDEIKHAVERAIERRRLLSKARELEKLTARHETMKDVQREFLLSLAAMIDAKSPFTRAHSERVAVYSRFFAEQMGVATRDIKLVTTGGRLHDIGKLGTPDAVINKPGKLDASEWQVVRQHPICGAELLRPMTMMRPYIPVVRWHHENHDGTGYPDGLKGIQIPPAVQIVKIADYYDAITSDRPYRKPMTLREACETLEREAGRAFTSDVVKAFIKMLHVAPWRAGSPRPTEPVQTAGS